MSVRIIQAGIDALRSDEKVAADLGDVADKVRDTMRVPARFRLSTRHGVSRRGAFAQIIMRGGGAILYEFGGRGVAPRAPLRNAARRKVSGDRGGN